VANNHSLEEQVLQLSKLDNAALEKALVAAVSVDADFLALLPMTVPPQPASQVFASMDFPEKLDRVKKALQEGFQKNRDRLEKLICDDFDYCNRRAEGEVKLVCGILGVLIGKGIIFVAYPKLWVLPIVIMYLYKNGFFDRLCQCKEKEKDKKRQ
jgi:hypothetical protein